MFRRRCVGVAVAASLPERNALALSNSRRGVTTRGQFNPIHAFTAQSIAPARQATNKKEFETMITNPGPLRVAYSPDYLDWLYRAYNSKVRYARERKKAEEVFQGMLLTGQPANSDAAAAALPGAPPPGQTLRPPHSIRRLAGEARRAAAQEKLDVLAQDQGLLDLFERQPQFPAIHIDKASRYHVVELFKEMVLDRVWEPEEVWDKALLYRAILNERKSSYPSNYKYILDTAEEVVLVPRSSGESSHAAASSSPSDTDVVGESSSLVPKEEDYLYFLYLVRRYYLDNAVEGHVVLRCHRSPNASELLFSHPPPKDEQEVLKGVFGRTGAASPEKAPAEGEAAAKRAAPGALARPRPPSSYPPIEALWRCEENESLLRVLVFGELNLLVSENPFVRFPNAQAYLTRPSAATPASASSAGAGEDGRSLDQQQQQFRDNRRGNRRGGGGRDGDGGVSLSSIISEKRGHLLAPLARNVAMMIDARANDVRRLQQRHEREDTAGSQKFLRGAQVEENPALYSSYTDWSYFNPRAVRAEDRDALSRQAIAALKTYDQASKDIYRVGYEEAESANAKRVLEGRDNAPSYVPTLPHFVALIKKDPYVSFLTYVALPTEYGASAPAQPTALSNKRQLEKLVVQLGRALHRTALDFHKQPLRRVNRQKVQVAAALLDRFVKDRWRVHCAEQPSTEGVRDMAQRFSAFVPFEGRIWDESGFPSDARVEDYERWMAPPTA
ncbi:mitochondrial edited mRNA stability factor 1 subunit [Leptomonas pyrrhocoris]|uniref:Mitochondrial edited mRNA stability factor 1 subunit n=1 Tax=Leptomonas pyrrhocoris TaxID=157538 RepID=A0A0M9G2W1_LEPPY|nr:mitochondrial edited mRNA stability factor 1 subunit [Leptomonas pyrrhocoris]KPA81049.1 mitochondrial edited mRNA stability factor 1 subunit [Leptomonas pyrrhocoris]|eukprot:XP_015659488.1 mitochondrial edited mRNA stability factor 1 subunit [Leptomonas pyrrhocoris]